MKLLKMLNLIKKSRLNSSQGFSLVELMVVVAIIGILAAIAIPNYQGFQRKARQNEAKVGLSGMHGSITVFAAEWGVGTPNLVQMGYSPEGQIQYNIGWPDAHKTLTSGPNPNQTTRSAIGNNYRGPVAADVDTIRTFVAFPGKMVLGANTAMSSAPAPNDPSAIPDGSSTGNCSGGVGTCNNQTACETPSGGCTTAGVWESQGAEEVDNTRLSNPAYVIGAIGNIGGSIVDVWTMSSGKILVNTKNGAE